MTVLVIGPNGSGKSAYAEKLATDIRTGELYYIATLLPFGEDGAARVKKHRAQRAGMGFLTVESPYALAGVSKSGTVLLEDVSNLVANLMFEKKSPDAAAEALDLVSRLRDGCENLIAVSIGGLGARDAADADTENYVAELNRVNVTLFEQADAVVELISGAPEIRKGALPCLC